MAVLNRSAILLAVMVALVVYCGGSAWASVPDVFDLTDTTSSTKLQHNVNTEVRLNFSDPSIVHHLYFTPTTTHRSRLNFQDRREGDIYNYHWSDWPTCAHFDVRPRYAPDDTHKSYESGEIPVSAGMTHALTLDALDSCDWHIRVKLVDNVEPQKLEEQKRRNIVCVVRVRYTDLEIDDGTDQGLSKQLCAKESNGDGEVDPKSSTETSAAAPQGLAAGGLARTTILWAGFVVVVLLGQFAAHLL